MVQRASSLSLRSNHQQARTERIGGSILDWVNDPDKNDISVEVFLTRTFHTVRRLALIAGAIQVTLRFLKGAHSIGARIAIVADVEAIDG